MINNGNRTVWSPIRSIIITKRSGEVVVAMVLVINSVIGRLAKST